MSKSVVIIGAGPAGLTCAWELYTAGFKDITIVDKDTQVGGISKTVQHNGNRIDIGGHRFFSKSDWVMNWWESFLPIQTDKELPLHLRYQGQAKEHKVASGNLAEANDDNVMIVRERLSRIYYNKCFFDYPLKLTIGNLGKLGIKKTFLFGLSYLKAHLFQIKPEESLEDFFVNRFGRKLYLQFFKEYTEKVWGVPCSSISADWGAQRVKSLSILSAILQALKEKAGLTSKEVQTSLIQEFIYPKFGPGQMWETVAQKLKDSGVRILMENEAVEIDIANDKVTSVTIIDKVGKKQKLFCDELVSTMPVKDLVKATGQYFPSDIQKVASDLQYRDFITVGLLYKKEDLVSDLKDNWIYIQEPGVEVGRVQIFNNWSPWLVSRSGTIWLGLEYFCQEGNKLWNLTDKSMTKLGAKEMEQIGLVSSNNPLDTVVVRVQKAYPGYFGDAYKSFDKVRDVLDEIPNLFLIGRNGMHRYNNMDHSMLTAKIAADQIISGIPDKKQIWNINVGDDYHENK